MTGLLRFSEGANLAMHAMAYLAHAGEDEVSARQIAAALGVSRDHLGKVLQRLVKDGLLESRRGPRGGFTLARAADETTLLEVLESIDGPLSEGDCLMGQRICGSRCVLSEVGERVYHQVREALARTTLSDLPDLT